ncbi:DUF4159 domain-containing protein [Frigoriglobus tundricola]|uniref:DUF4159 domain-containing protein n=1 Tax=Frigoriglobus tundricola TaxID=2774151 RepID=A0A6M5Z6F1_9BACT|nr:DUF4159 domain-containing protein [Frigoriglobus tundricola]QJX00971.1 hypothetical protein FTUN_8609 [Frigoriglobus tundricola]
MIRSLLAAALALGVGLTLLSGTPTAAQPAGAPPKGTQDAELVEKVKNSIDKGVRYLKKTQKRDGDWEGIVLGEIAGLKGGVTALATLALLNAGLKPDDPAVAKALDYLRAVKPDKTYVVALQTMVFAEARQPKDLPKIAENVEWFKKNVIRRSGQLDGWSYPANAIADNSNTQYALLGLYAAKTAGVKVDDQLWSDILDYYNRTQHQDPANNKAGFWTYHNAGDRNPSFTMTVGGACGLIIAGMGLDKSEQGLNDATGVAANCGVYTENSALARGMLWVGANFNFLDGKSYFYNYYGIERLGRLSGQRFIGRIDWYREGCERLIRMQDGDGSFVYRDGEKRGGLDAGQPVITTSFAVLFLSKGRTPVLVTKFAWGRFRPGAANDRTVLQELDENGVQTARPDWNRKHNDCRNIVEFAARELFDNVPLSWQVYDPRLQGLADDNTRIDSEVGLLLQSPVVYLNGHGAMPFVGRGTELLSAEERILKRYVEEGGFLIGEACCGDKEFAASFEKLLARLFPGNTLRKMPPEHAIWRTFPGVSPADFPDLMYLDRGCRTVAVFSPSPLAGYWEERRFMPADGRDPKNRGQKAFCLARNIIAYATGLELPKPKLTKTILVNGAETGIARSKFRALQLKYVSDEGAQPPPAADALRNLMGYLAQNAKLDVAKTTEVLAPGDTRLAKYKFMYLHGRRPVVFDGDSADNVKANLQTGGLLLADAACNEIKLWKEFDKSFRDAMEKMWGQKLVTIPPNDRFFEIAREAGIDLRTVKCRREKPDGSGPEAELRSYPVLLEGIKIDGRWVVVYSRYDIGCAIEGHKAADCLGHDKESALKIASAVVLYSLKR